MSSRVSNPADVAHDLRAGAGTLAGGDGAAQGLEPVFGDHVLGHAHLHADDHVGVLGDGFGAGVHLGEIDVVELGYGRQRP
jgi:hypothetical protein